MNMRSLITTGALLAALGSAMAGCSTGSHPVAATKPAPQPPSQSPSVTSDSQSPSATSNSLNCNAEVSSGPPSVTAQQVISGLSGVSTSLATPNQTDVNILVAAAMDLDNYSGNKLSNDASQFAQDAGNYTGTAVGSSMSLDTSYASTVQADIATLTKDCPSH